MARMHNMRFGSRKRYSDKHWLLYKRLYRLCKKVGNCVKHKDDKYRAEISQLLKHKGVQHIIKYNREALRISLFYYNIDIAKLLLKAGADIHTTTDMYFNYSDINKSIQVARFILENGGTFYKYDLGNSISYNIWKTAEKLIENDGKISYLCRDFLNEYLIDDLIDIVGDYVSINKIKCEKSEFEHNQLNLSKYNPIKYNPLSMVASILGVAGFGIYLYKKYKCN